MADLYNSGVRVLIDNFLLEESKKTRSYGDYWSASSAGYCMRKLVFERLGVPKTKEDDPRQQRVFSAGHVFHEWIQGITRDAGVSVAQEVELQDEDLMIRGHFDDLILIRHKDDSWGAPDGMPARSFTEAEVSKPKLILYDYKTANSRSFGYKKEISHFHRMQVGTYIYMLRKYPDDKAGIQEEYRKMYKNITEGRVLILEKDTLRTKEFEVHWDKELAIAVHQYWSTLNGYWKKNKLPNCTCADFEGGFMAKEQYNDYYYNGEPCSLEWFELWQRSKKDDDK